MSFKNFVMVGKYIHSVDRYHVVRGDGNCVPRIGAILHFKDGEKAGFVADVFGPVSRPYLLVKGKKAREYYARKKDILGVKGV